jgi:circadian clock protein KaiB
MYRLRLYVTGNSSLSSRALANITALCDERLPGRYEIDVVDVLADPKKAAEADVAMTPTLIKETPGPVRWLLGDLGDRARVLRTLGIGEKQRRSKPRRKREESKAEPRPGDRPATPRRSGHDAVAAAAREAARAAARLTHPRERLDTAEDRPNDVATRRANHRNER